MSIVIQDIVGSNGDRCSCTITHGTSTLVADVHGDKDSLTKFINDELIVEIGFDQVVSARLILDFNNNDSRIAQNESTVSLFGVVHNILEHDESIFDIYIQNGPEYFSVTSGEWAINPGTGDGVVVDVTGICFYPTST